VRAPRWLRPFRRRACETKSRGPSSGQTASGCPRHRGFEMRNQFGAVGANRRSQSPKLLVIGRFDQFRQPLRVVAVFGEQSGGQRLFRCIGRRKDLDQRGDQPAARGAQLLGPFRRQQRLRRDDVGSRCCGRSVPSANRRSRTGQKASGAQAPVRDRAGAATGQQASRTAPGMGRQFAPPARPADRDRATIPCRSVAGTWAVVEAQQRRRRMQTISGRMRDRRERRGAAVRRSDQKGGCSLWPGWRAAPTRVGDLIDKIVRAGR